MSYTKLSTSKQTFSTPNNDNDPTATETSLYCDNCKNPLREWGFIHIEQLETTKQISFLCSLRCKKIQKAWIKFCPNCKQEFNIRDKGKRNQKYCSVKCRFDFSQRQECGPCQNCGNKIPGFERNKYYPRKYCSKGCALAKRQFTYNNNYYCDRCGKYIKKEDAIKKFKHFTCPTYSCCGNKLRKTSRNAKLNQRRNDVKRIE